ncbi:hypothetical protein [uncultured Marinobacter sp.]|uniref:hypothetical protein n=1 Tax=uncultured Marinobacter sp. TaxID=187379 RepID=UPI002609F81D|nr:hypothetical protein [uncultured Marinobacter sp.]
MTIEASSDSFKGVLGVASHGAGATMVNHRLSITWSNGHQERFEEVLSTALANGQMEITDDGKFSFTDEFYEVPEVQFHLEKMPSGMFDEKVSAWVKKTQRSD